MCIYNCILYIYETHMESSSNEACSNIEIDIQTYIFSFFKGKQRAK